VSCRLTDCNFLYPSASQRSLRFAPCILLPFCRKLRQSATPRPADSAAATAGAQRSSAKLIQFKTRFFKLTAVKALSASKKEHLLIKHPTYAHEFIIWSHWRGRDDSVVNLALDPCAKEVFSYLKILHCDGKNEDGSPLAKAQAVEYAKRLIATTSRFEEFIGDYFVPHRHR
jgi:hypothetical protein